MNRTPLAAIGLALITLAACGCTKEEPSDRLVQDCALPDQEASLTWLYSDGSLGWTPDAIAEDGSMTVRYCDGPTARATRITGLTAGDEIDWQGGAMTDGDRRVIHVADITTTSTVPEAAGRLEGVTRQCISVLGSCEPTPVEKPEVIEEPVTAADSAAPAPTGS